jgi:hypothetical protein
MTAVVAVVMRCGHTFSGGTTARVVGGVGGRRDGPSRHFGCHAIMIAHARASYRFGVVGSVRQWQMQPPIVNACSTRGSGSAAPPGSINRKRGRGNPLPRPLASLPPCFLASLSGCAPFHFRPPLASSSRAIANRNGSP